MYVFRLNPLVINNEHSLSGSLEPEVDVYSKLPGYDPDLLVDEEELRIATQPIHLSRSSHPTLHQESGRIPRIQEKRSVLKRIPRQHTGPARDIDLENRIYYLPQYWRGPGDEIPATGMSLNTEIPRLSLDLGEDLTDEDGLMIPTSSLHDTLLRDIQVRIINKKKGLLTNFQMILFFLSDFFLL